jgi:hypothetical protein
MNQQLAIFVRENALFLIVLLGIVAAFVLLRTKGSDVNSVTELDEMLSSGQPAVVEFYSNT